MEFVITLIIGAIGIGLALARSTWLVDYAVFVFVLNRGVRRVVDYYINQQFNPLSPISLTPLILAGAMVASFLIEFRVLPGWARRIFLCFGGAIGYAFAVGFLQQGLGAIYALSEVLLPMGMAGYVMVRNPEIPVRDRWIRSFAWAAIVASAYGWYQYLTIPPWDAFWVQEVGFVGYLGALESTKLNVFSTMAERGPLSCYLGLAVVPMMVSRKWRTFLGWPAVVLIFSAILLSTARTGLIIAVVATLVFLLVNRGANRGQIVLAAAVIVLAGWFGLKRMPGSERIIERLETLENIEEDGSLQGRLEIMAGGTETLLENPLGGGLGAGGLGTRVNTGNIKTTTKFGDAGYFQIILIYGVAGTALLLAGLIIAWKRLSLYFRIRTLRSDHVMLIRALMIAMIPACFVGDVLTGFSIFWLALGCGLAIPREGLARTIALLEAAQTDDESEEETLPGKAATLGGSAGS